MTCSCTHHHLAPQLMHQDDEKWTEQQNAWPHVLFLNLKKKKRRRETKKEETKKKWDNKEETKKEETKKWVHITSSLQNLIQNHSPPLPEFILEKNKSQTWYVCSSGKCPAKQRTNHENTLNEISMGGNVNVVPRRKRRKRKKKKRKKEKEL